MNPTIYHNPRCSKSCATLELLRQRGLEPVVIEYLTTPPTAEELKNILGMLGIGPRELLRRTEARQAGLEDPALSDDALIAVMIANPAVIERPIVIADGKAAIGRPPERVLTILPGAV
ncbi:MAG: arsenate reductase (glutaredoxin) [Alphaproteobacteria bacterium]|nr:arsenate reductase (glutaredoxin) [Alphaproteobacteria bacterium]